MPNGGAASKDRNPSERHSLSARRAAKPHLTTSVGFGGPSETFTGCAFPSGSNGIGWASSQRGDHRTERGSAGFQRQLGRIGKLRKLPRLQPLRGSGTTALGSVRRSARFSHEPSLQNPGPRLIDREVVLDELAVKLCMFRAWKLRAHGHSTTLHKRTDQSGVHRPV